MGVMIVVGLCEITTFFSIKIQIKYMMIDMYDLHRNISDYSNNVLKLFLGQQLLIIFINMGCGVSSQFEQQRISTPVPSSHRLIIPPESSFDDLQSRQTAQEEYHGYSFFDSILMYFDSVHQSPEKKKQFYSLLGNKMGELYTTTLNKVEDKLIKKQIGSDDFKVHFSKTIILQILNMINKLQERQNWKSERVQIFKKLAECQKKIIEFLEFKYPRNKKDFIPTELEEVFYPVDDSEHTDYDLLINAGIEFDYERIMSYERKEVIKQLKKLINACIIETNRFFDDFREQMQSIFNNLEGTFKIGRKISENVNVYKDLQSNTMEIHSPEIFRVLIKFIRYIDCFFINSLEMLKKKKYFKILQKNDEEMTYFPLYTGKNPLISMLTSSLEPGSKEYQHQEQSQQVILANFNDTLAKILTKKTHIPEINQSEIKTIKYAKNISKFVEFLAIEKLIYLITQLVILREKMEKKNRKAIDLITCNINDLLRCQFMGSKNAILDVFNELKKLQKEGKIKIIRIKNRFATPLNDVLVNFKFVGEKQSFIICEIQLILKKTGFERSAKFQAHAKVNHVLYELQRSIFGPLAEMSLLLTHNDTRMGYEKKIKLERARLKAMRCPEEEILSCEYDLPIPYVCSLCTQFYSINQNSFPIYRCQNCNFYVCPKCLFEFDPQFSEECYMKEIFNILKENFMPDLDENQDYGFFFFNRKYLKVEEIAKAQKNFFDCLQEKMVELDEEFAFVIRFMEGKKYFNAYHRHANGELLPTFYDFLPRFQRKQFKNNTFSPYDIVLFLDSNCAARQRKLKELNLTYIQLTDASINLKLCPDAYIFKAMQNLWMIDVGDQQRDNDTTSIPESNPDKGVQIEKILENYRPRDGQLLLDYLDIYQLSFGDFEIKNLRFAKLKSNHIKDLTPILKFETLEQIDASRNEIGEVKFQKSYPKLRILDFSENFIESIVGISNQTLPSLKQLNLQNNMMSYFPKLFLSKLLWLNLNDNRIEDIENFKDSNIPKLRKLSISNNAIKQIPMNSQMKELLDIEAEGNCIENIQFLFCAPKIEQVFLQRNKIKEYPQSLHLFYLQKLDLCKNQLSDISNFETSQFSVIKEIDLSHNSIKKVPVMEFETLQILNLSHNKIHCLEKLSNSQAYENVVTLNLSYNSITEFSILLMQCLSNLDMSHNSLVNMGNIVHSKLPVLQKVNLSYNKISVMPPIDHPQLQVLNLEKNEIQSMHFFNQSHTDKLRYLNINDNKIKKFISAEFPALEELYIKRNQLQDLTEIKEEHLMVLKVLDMSGNDSITELPSMFLQSVEKVILEGSKQVGKQIRKTLVLEKFKFSNLSELKILQLRHNSIQNFPTMNLPSLTMLFLDSNQIESIKDLSMSELPCLEQLRLSNNKLQRLQILKLPKLAILNIEKNNLEDIEILEGYKTPQIMELKMAKNKISKLCNLKSNSLSLMDLSENQISEGIDVFFNSNLPKLLVLKLNKNQIKGALPVANNFVSLKNLDLSKNSIDNLQNFFMKSNLPKLDIIKLNNNSLTVLNEIKFPRLKEINIANNQIKDLDDFTYSELPKINKIWLDNNQIVELPKLQFNTLSFLNIEKNKIEDLEQFGKSLLPSLEKLSLNLNKISVWPKQFYLDKLLKLNLNHNRIMDIFWINDETTPELLELHLKDNQIETIQEFNLPRLIVLNLDGNPITTSEQRVKQAFKAHQNGKFNSKLNLILNKKASGKDQNLSINQIVKLKERHSEK